MIKLAYKIFYFEKVILLSKILLVHNNNNLLYVQVYQFCSLFFIYIDINSSSDWLIDCFSIWPVLLAVVWTYKVIIKYKAI